MYLAFHRASLCITLYENSLFYYQAKNTRAHWLYFVDRRHVCTIRRPSVVCWWERELTPLFVTQGQVGYHYMRQLQEVILHAFKKLSHRVRRYIHVMLTMIHLWIWQGDMSKTPPFSFWVSKNIQDHCPYVYSFVFHYEIVRVQFVDVGVWVSAFWGYPWYKVFITSTYSVDSNGTWDSMILY